jgi:hypothetical protein
MFRNPSFSAGISFPPSMPAASLWGSVRQTNQEAIAFIRKHTKRKQATLEHDVGAGAAVTALLASCNEETIEACLLRTPTSWFTLSREASDAITGAQKQPFVVPKDSSNLAYRIEQTQLNLLSLHSIRDLAMLNVEQASRLYGARIEVLHKLATMPLRQILAITQTVACVVRMKHGSNYEYWKPVLSLPCDLAAHENWKTIMCLRGIQSSAWVPARQAGGVS